MVRDQDIAILRGLLPLTAFLFLGAVAAIVGFRLMTGAIVTRGLITDVDGGAVSAAKLQLLMATVTGVLFYASKIATSSDAGALPPVDGELLAMIGGSNGFMLGGLAIDKLRAALRSHH